MAASFDDLDRASERGFEIESDPTRPEVMRLGERPTMKNGPRIADRYRVIIPILGKLLDASDHLFGRQFRPRGKLSMVAFARWRGF